MTIDPELLAALAEGRLTPADAAALETRIAADPASQTELAAQRKALAFIRTAATPHLADHERSSLHTAVAERLGLTSDGLPTPLRRRRVAWGALAVGASALVAIVALGPMAGLVGDGGDGGAMTVADGATTLGDDATRVAGELGAQPPATEAGDATVPLVPTGTGEEAVTTLATAFVDRAADTDKMAQDLVLLRTDPEGLQVVAGPTDETTPCLVEAVAYLGSDALLWFPYPYPPETEGAAVTTVEYAVFVLGDTTDGSAVLVAFAPTDCALPIPVP